MLRLMVNFSESFRIILYHRNFDKSYTPEFQQNHTNTGKFTFIPTCTWYSQVYKESETKKMSVKEKTRESEYFLTVIAI